MRHVHLCNKCFMSLFLLYYYTILQELSFIPYLVRCTEVSDFISISIIAKID